MNVNAMTLSGWTPLHYAARRGYTNVVKLLLAKSADVSAKDKNGRTALDYARTAGHADVVELLRGANIHAEKRNGDSSSTIRP